MSEAIEVDSKDNEENAGKGKTKQQEAVAGKFDADKKLQKQRQHRKVKKVIYGVLAVVMLTVAIVMVAVSKLGLFQSQMMEFGDFWAAQSYEPEEEIASLRDDLKLTDRAKQIFAASDPEIEEDVAFNSNCTLKEKGGYILGCYTGGADKIHIFRVEEEELSGIHEATAAHELLHAVWARTPEKEKEQIETSLLQFMEEKKDEFTDVTELYEESQWADELHSRVGTEFAVIPSELEEHYAKYFLDRQAIVNFYQGYKGAYTEAKSAAENLAAEITELQERIAAMKTQLDEDRSGYRDRMDKYKEDLQKYNECARTRSCFDAAGFEAEASRLNTEGGNLNYLREVINANVRAYNADIELLNQKVDEYNANVAHLQYLNEQLNSKVETMDDVQ